MRPSHTTRRLAIWAGLSAAILSSPSIAQRSAKELQQKLDDKLAKEWVTNAEWITDFDKAKAEAKRRGKQIFGYFTRSYAP
jgi:ribosomal protein S17E